MESRDEPYEKGVEGSDGGRGLGGERNLSKKGERSLISSVPEDEREERKALGGKKKLLEEEETSLQPKTTKIGTIYIW